MNNSSNVQRPSQRFPGLSALSRYEPPLNSLVDRLSSILTQHKYLFLALFSAVYFADTLYHASRRLFWYDELFSVYLTRVPSLAALWRALTNGADFHGILFHTLTRYSAHLVGEGNIGLRLPAILGFWIFCLCLFRFVSARSSVVPAFISLLFPMITVAYWYASEARGYGIALGFCGLALICWQVAAAGGSNRFWSLLGLGGALACALLSHSYAFLVFVPLALGELWRDVNRARIDWPVWTTMAVSSSVLITSIPLLHAAKTVNGIVPETLRRLVPSYQFLLRPPVAGFLALWVILLCLSKMRTPSLRSTLDRRSRSHEIVVLAAFLTLPIFMCVAGKLAHAQVFPRYGIYAVAGIACLVGLSVERRPTAAMGTLLLVVGCIGLEFIAFRSSTIAIEPGLGGVISTSISAFKERYQWMDAPSDKTLPIVLGREFLEETYYAPPNLAPRLMFPIWPGHEGALVERAYAALRACCHPSTPFYGLADVVASHPKFLVYGELDEMPQLNYFVNSGATVTILRTSSDHFLVLVSRP